MERVVAERDRLREIPKAHANWRMTNAGAMINRRADYRIGRQKTPKGTERD